MITRRPWIAGVLGLLAIAFLATGLRPVEAGLIGMSGPKGVSSSSSSSSSSGGGAEFGTLTDYAGLNVTQSGIITLDGSEGDTPLWNANCTWGATNGVGGRGGWECVPPTAGAAGGSVYSALGQINLKNGGGSADIQRLWMRWYMRVGSAWADNNEFDAVKHVIFWANPGPVRPMVYIDSRPGELGIAPADSVFASPAQGTTRWFSETYAGNSFWDGNNRADFYLGQSSTTVTDTTPNPDEVKPVLDDLEWVCFEILLDSRTGSANGIRLRATRADGTILSDLDETMSWDHEAVANDGDIEVIDVLGGYFNGYTDAAGANNYMRIDGYVSFDMDQTTFHGCDSEFLN